MAAMFDSDLMSTTSDGQVMLNLKCGYGQPVTSTVYLKKNDGGLVELKQFDGDVNNLDLGDSSTLKQNRIEIHSTIKDIRDTVPGQEVIDISLYEQLVCNDVSVDTEFTKKTKGKGQIINCFYEVTII